MMRLSVFGKVGMCACVVVLTCLLGGCISSEAPSTHEPELATAVRSEPEEPEAPEASEAPGASASETEEEPMQSRMIEVSANGATVAFELNDSPAADALLAQLPLTTEVEDFSTNEKIFYPPASLDTTDAPHAEGGAGTLAYYAPWGDVVMFYGGYSPNSGLYELGQAVSGTDAIATLSGTIEIVVAE